MPSEPQQNECGWVSVVRSNEWVGHKEGLHRTCIVSRKGKVVVADGDRESWVHAPASFVLALEAVVRDLRRGSHPGCHQAISREVAGSSRGGTLGMMRQLVPESRVPRASRMSSTPFMYSRCTCTTKCLKAQRWSTHHAGSTGVKIGVCFTEPAT